jgi:hypothetical protein
MAISDLCVNVLTGSDAANINGIQINSNQLVSASFHAYFGDSGAVGTLKIQASNDPCSYGNLAADFTVANWVDIPGTSTAVTGGASKLITIAQTSYRWMRAVWTATSGGTTTINVNMNAISV